MEIEARFETSQGIQIIKNVTVICVKPDGSFHIKTANGQEMVDCSPEYVKLYDATGVEVVATVQMPEADLLKLQIKALSDYQDFLEECIVEMAGRVYAG